MTIVQWVKDELRPIEAIAIIIGIALIGWQIYSYGERKADRAREEIRHAQTQQRIDNLNQQLAPIQTSLDAQAKVTAQQTAVAAQQAQAAVVLRDAADAIRRQNELAHNAVQGMSPTDLAAALKALGIASTVTPTEAKAIVTTSVDLQGCQRARDNLAAQVDNCHDQLATRQAIIDSQRVSLDDLARAAAVNKQIRDQSITDLRQQLQDAKGGSRFDRFLKDAEKVAAAGLVGYAVGRGHR